MMNSFLAFDIFTGEIKTFLTDEDRVEFIKQHTVNLQGKENQSFSQWAAASHCQHAKLERNALVKEYWNRGTHMPKILPVNTPGDCAQHSLSDHLYPEQITKILGFPPNVPDDETKVEHSWGFTVDGDRCGIWDYKGSRWSAFGPRTAFEKIGLL